MKKLLIVTFLLLTQNIYANTKLENLIEFTTSSLFTLSNKDYSKEEINNLLISDLNNIGVQRALILPIYDMAKSLQKYGFEQESIALFNKADQFEKEFRNDLGVDPTVMNSATAEETRECLTNCAGLGVTTGLASIVFAPTPAAAAAVAFGVAITCATTCAPDKVEDSNQSDEDDTDDNCQREQCPSSDERVAFDPDNPDEHTEIPLINLDVNDTMEPITFESFNDLRFINIGNPIDLEGIR